MDKSTAATLPDMQRVKTESTASNCERCLELQKNELGQACDQCKNLSSISEKQTKFCTTYSFITERK